MSLSSVIYITLGRATTLQVENIFSAAEDSQPSKKFLGVKQWLHIRQECIASYKSIMHRHPSASSNGLAIWKPFTCKISDRYPVLLAETLESSSLFKRSCLIPLHAQSALNSFYVRMTSLHPHQRRVNTRICFHLNRWRTTAAPELGFTAGAEMSALKNNCILPNLKD